MTGFAEEARIRKAEEAHEMGIDDALISALVDQFYARIRSHPSLGPIFARRVREWPVHLGRMKAFWGSIAIESGRYHGNPMLKHVAIGEIREEHFSDWLALWASTVKDVIRDDRAAEFFNSRAKRIAQSLTMGIALHGERQRQTTSL
ncbi:MAG: group III truncated hemoglobin [Pseudomonadota bacterium]